jgi:hypothetical protein
MQTLNFLAAHFRLGFGGQRRAQIAFARRAGDGHDHLALVFGALGHFDGGATFAPVEMPTRNPSSFASRRAMANASSLLTWMHSTICGFPLLSFKWRFFGTKPAPVPWILCGPGLSGSPGERLRDDRRILRLNRDGLKDGFARLDDFDATGDRAARADGGDEYPPCRRCRPDFLGRRLAM